MTVDRRIERMIDGPVGQIQLIVDEPSAPARGVVVISHPQPLLGGSPQHIVPVTLARKLVAESWITVRPCFRGVGKTTGPHDEGVGEYADSLAVVEYIKREYPGVPVALVGFSFGAHVFARAAIALQGSLRAVVLLGLPVGHVPGGRYYAPVAIPQDCLLLHGEQDEMAPLDNLLEWARPDRRPVVLYPGANHFFKGCLAEVAEQVSRHLNLPQA
ncbi:MAG TPA: alpha/beta fold hydrolase [Pseudomonas sp.]|nr:alpha/beta fold hydrolase [Pseudomonas sp.]